MNGPWLFLTRQNMPRAADKNRSSHIDSESVFLVLCPVMTSHSIDNDVTNAFLHATILRWVWEYKFHYCRLTNVFLDTPGHTTSCKKSDQLLGNFLDLITPDSGNRSWIGRFSVFLLFSWAFNSTFDYLKIETACGHVRWRHCGGMVLNQIKHDNHVILEHIYSISEVCLF